MGLMAVSKRGIATLGAISVYRITLLNLNIALVAWRVSIAPPKDPFVQSSISKYVWLLTNHGCHDVCAGRSVRPALTNIMASMVSS